MNSRSRPIPRRALTVRTAGNLAFGSAGLAVAVPSAFLLTVAVAALRPVRPAQAGTASPRLRVLVPAHNEADLLPRCLDSLAQQDYPVDRYGVTVVADNCSDETAMIAARLGTDVKSRT